MRSSVDHQVRVGRLEHQALRGGHLAQPGEIVPLDRADVRVRQEPALERPLARPGHVRREVRVAVAVEPCGDLRVHLRPLARQDQQLLGVAADRVVEHPLDLVRRVQVGAVRRERAVLAVAPARPRQRQREVAREGDSPAAQGRRGYSCRPSVSLRAPSRPAPSSQARSPSGSRRGRPGLRPRPGRGRR
jgi:hypothetical protein